MGNDSVLIASRQRVTELAAKHRLLTIYSSREYVDAGGLIAYAAHYPDLYRRAAAYVDKIFKGAKPADLPIEQPTKLEIVVNLKAAKALGLTVPHAARARRRGDRMRRREFIMLLGGAATGWTLDARAQTTRVSRIAILDFFPSAASMDSVGPFREGLRIRPSGSCR